MSLESDLIAALNPLVGNRVHLAILPLNVTMPAIRLSVIAVTPDNTVCGASDLDDYRVQIDVFGPNYGALVALRRLVFDAVDAAFPLAIRLNDMTDYDADLKLHRRIIEVQIPAE
ncbi:hypothetical protein PT7_P050 (plasmid) [Pusillimonas sp. T7-7]|uniref:DUF3168 domain-containing protein n=1 Tax=Pusillimonas sp. (strain T7-7) TaxID=1007105 RepID=UPI0002084BBF|nr:DUF3168 domain-containing protein [Pusillimonas sp. T7-7]AEC22286.1 hypothetical protein PT7_P050 [Pusillimonas sp. T7-7]